MSKLTKNMDIVLQQGTDLIEFYRENPCIAAYDLLGVDLAPIQRVLFEAMWFKAYVLVVAGRGAGKSVSIDSRVLINNKGLIHLSEILPNVPKYLFSDTDEVINYRLDLYTNSGVKSSKKVALERKITGLKITTKSGFTISGSTHHPILTSNMTFSTLEDLSVGDEICIQLNQNIFGSTVIDIDIAYIIGLIVGGINTDSELKYYADLNGFSDILENINIDSYTLSYVPYLVRTSTKESVISFLQGVFDASSIINNNSIKFHLDNYSSIFDIQLLLLNLGIISSRSENILTISDPYTNVFSSIINSRLAGKKAILYSNFSNKFIIDNYYIDTIESIVDWVGDCYDFEMDMEGEPNYFANGFINHNTFISGTLAALLCLLYPGYRVGLIGPSYRQCLVLSDDYTTFWTSQGLVLGTSNLLNDDVEDIKSLNNINTINNKWINKQQDCVRISTTYGYELSGSINHKILVLDSNCSLTYKSLIDLTEDDFIAINKGFNLFGNNDQINHRSLRKNNKGNISNIPNILTNDLSYLIGLILGDGTIEYNIDVKKYRVNFYSSDTELTNTFKHLIRKIFNVEPAKDFNRNGNICSSVNNKDIVEFLLGCGMSCNLAHNKEIPKIILGASKDNVVSFLQGLYDTDGCLNIMTSDGYKVGSVGFCTSSKKVAMVVVSMLINLGLFPSINVDKRCGDHTINGNKVSTKISYNINLTGKYNIKLFKDVINFKLTRKKTKLEELLSSNSSKISNTNKIPYTVKPCYRLYRKLNSEFDLTNEEYYKVRMGIRCCNKNKTGEITVSNIKYIINLCKKYNILNDDYNLLKYLIDLNLSYVKLKTKQYFVADTLDIEVANEHCYFSSGFISHNSKMIFSEVEKLYAQSSILKEATEKRPIRGTDTCYLKFKSVAGRNGSFIEALPIGVDGAKIRGSRFYCLLIDEFAQVPQKIIETVLAPMSITKLDPMKKVRELERRKKLIEAGLATEADFEEESINKMIGTSSGYYKFNHMYKRMREYWKQIDEGSDDHAVFQVPYTLLPEGFLDPKNVENARRVMSDHEFRMEYLADMVSDSEGFFKASLLDECTIGNNYSIEFKGDKGHEYIIGIDPNQGGTAKCGVVIIKLEQTHHKVVRAMELDGKTTQAITTAIQDICDTYNVARIFMDRGGGGKAVCDLLEEGYNDHEPILNRADPDNLRKEGKHLLELVTFNTSWISDANFATLALLEDKLLKFPEPPLNTTDDKMAVEFEKIELLKKQCISIVVTQTAGGALHFDTPKRSMNKDLYSAFILACYGLKIYERESDEEEESPLFSAGGLVRQRESSKWNSISSNTVSNELIAAAVLKKVK